MPKQLSLEESYDQCLSNGMISPQEEVALQFNLYINLLKKEIENKFT